MPLAHPAAFPLARLARLAATAAGLATAAAAQAHVPYIEGADYSAQAPFVLKTVANSKAIYGWLQSGTDVDYTSLQVTSPVTLQVEVDVQACPALAAFLPSYAIVGPGLPPPTEPLPVTLPPGYGAVVVPNLAPGVERPTFYEPAGGHTYWSGIPTTVVATTPGPWAILVWDPYHLGGDYVMSTGYLEKTTPKDLLLTAQNLPVIRANGELHTPCPGN
jgi:hypothetical protein